MRILVTNDDGVHAPGILALARAIAKDGHEVVVAAPLTDMSGSGAALGPGHASGVRVERLELSDLDAVTVYGVEGPPGMAVMAGHLGAFGARPDIVASGINLGGNTGRSVLFSGTVGAALAAANFGIRGVAVSQQLGDPWLIETGAAFGAAAVAWAADSAPNTVLNVNVPNRPIEQIAGVREGKLAPFGVVRTVFKGEVEGRLQLVLRETDETLEPDTDTMLVNQGYVSVTGLIGPRAVEAEGVVEALASQVLRGR
jgi:5'-nucleotidase